MGSADAVHSTHQTLKSYASGKLEQAPAERVERHLLSCAACQRWAAEMTSDSFLGRLRNVQSQPYSSRRGVSPPAASSMFS
jgi:anti-sigma factor RsiW